MTMNSDESEIILIEDAEMPELPKTPNQPLLDVFLDGTEALAMEVVGYISDICNLCERGDVQGLSAMSLIQVQLANFLANEGVISQHMRQISARAAVPAAAAEATPEDEAFTYEQPPFDLLGTPL